MQNPERGNAIFLVLIGIVLFAALSFAVSMSGRGGGSQDKEKALLNATEMVQFADAMHIGIGRLMAINRCTTEQIDFSGNGGKSKRNNGLAFDYTNPTSPVDDSCDVFKHDAGGVVSRLFNPEGMVDPATIGATVTHPQSWLVAPLRVLGHGSDAADASGTDLTLMIGRLTSSQCVTLNNRFGVTNPSGNPPVETYDCAASPYTGSFPACANPIGDTVTDLVGRKDFCIENSLGHYIYFHVLIER